MNYVEEWAIDYEQKYGKKPSKAAIEIIEHIIKVGDILTNKGREDGQKGERRYSDEAFPQLVRDVFHMTDADAETVDAVADLWKSDYMDGYREGCAM